MAAKITIQTLLDAGCHYGHQTRRWNPKMKSYIFGERNGIYILDLKQTMLGADKAYTFLKETAAKGGKILFVGTKKQAQEPVATQAQRCGMPYINQRWLGGMLTNFVTMRSRINRMEELEAMVEDGRMATLPKKEQAVLGKELTKLQTNLGGVRDMTSLPQAIFVVDSRREEIGIREANRLHIPSSPCWTPTPTPTWSSTASPPTTTPSAPFPSCASLPPTPSWPAPARSRSPLRRWPPLPLRPPLSSSSQKSCPYNHVLDRGVQNGSDYRRPRQAASRDD